jgi:hypothetical protein
MVISPVSTTFRAVAGLASGRFTQDRLTEYDETRDQLPGFGTGKRPTLWQTVVGTGIAAETASIAWLDQVIATFEADGCSAPPRAPIAEPDR